MAIVLPAGQAVVTGFAAFVTVSSVAWYQKIDNPLAAGGVAAGVAFGLSWIAALFWWRSRVEAATNEPQPAIISPVTHPAETVRVELEKPNGAYTWIDYLDLPFDRDLVYRAAGELVKRDFETSNLGGAGKPITRSQAEAFRDWLISKDLAGWYRPDAHVKGWGIKPAGRAILRRLYQAGVMADVIDPLPPSRKADTSAAHILARMQTYTDTHGALVSDIDQPEDTPAVLVGDKTSPLFRFVRRLPDREEAIADDDLYNEMWQK